MAKHIRIVRKRQESCPLQLDMIQEEKEKDWEEEERTVCDNRDTTYNHVVLVQSIKLDEHLALQR